jgi:2-polyprenyl-6-methoxyphenol hydroxylase-like FAD-dependent oxidoreductase
MINKVRRITIFGGGTSGWLSAAYLSRNLKIPAEITLIEDTSLGPIGVGEGTQPMTARFLHECGIEPKDWLKDSNAVFKYGVELIGWNDEPYFVDNDVPINCIVGSKLFTSDYFIDKPYSEVAAWHPAYQLAKANVSSKFDEYLDVNHGSGPESYGAVHFDAYAILRSIKNILGDSIKHIDTKITDIRQDVYGITELVGVDGTKYTADLFVDCSGFQSLLLEKTLKSPFTSYSNILPCDSAVVFQTQYKDPQKECHPYTKATTMNAGWRFTIPTFKRVGNGYVYSSKHITPEQAEQEMREALGEFEAPARHLKMKCGVHKETAVKNVCAVGLAAGFIEPLEATGITFTTAAVKSLTELLNMTNNVWNDFCRQNINRGFYEMTTEILAFVWAHYHFSSRNDTEFWQDIRKQELKNAPKEVQEILSFFLPRPQKYIFINPSSMFCNFQWFTMLHAGGAYKNVASDLSEKQKAYTKYFLDSHTARVNLAKETFPNQYDYLETWYTDWDLSEF